MSGGYFASVKLADGGDIVTDISEIPNDTKIRIDRVYVEVYEDNYTDGEGEMFDSYNIDVDDATIPVKSLLTTLNNSLGISTNPKDYVILDGIIHYNELVDSDYTKPSESQIEEWKKGEKELYTANYSIDISIIDEIEITDEVLRELTGIEIYKKGGSVKSKGKKKPRVTRYYFEDSGYEYAGGGSTYEIKIENKTDDYNYQIELEKIKLINEKIHFDLVKGSIDEDKFSLSFYRNGNRIFYIVGKWYDETTHWGEFYPAHIEAEIVEDSRGSETGFDWHPFDSMGGFDKEKFIKNLNVAFREINLQIKAHEEIDEEKRLGIYKNGGSTDKQDWYDFDKKMALINLDQIH